MEGYMDLCNLNTIRSLLGEGHTFAKKIYGQNFLINPAIPERISQISSEGAAEGTGVLEIGPGIGCLTSCLSSVYASVTALEIDEDLLPILDITLADKDNVRIVLADVLKTDLPEIIGESFGNRPVHVCANLPYYITTPVIMHLIDREDAFLKPLFSRMSVMVQREVADRICALPGSPNYGALSVAVALRGEAVRCLTVSPGNFYPAPSVSSAVVRIDLYPDGPRHHFDVLSSMEDEEASETFTLARKLIADTFSTRRKTLVNSLSKKFGKGRVISALKEMGKREDIRGEKLSAEDFLILASLLKD